MAAAHDRGKKALEAKDYKAAITAFTEAIKSNPEAPTYYLDRSAAYTRSGSEFTSKALDDAEAGLVLAKARDRREIIGKAQFRRAVVLYALGRYKDAEQCFAWAKEKDAGEKMLGIWEIKVKNKLDAGEGLESKVDQYPDKDVVTKARGEDASSSTTTAKSSAPKALPTTQPSKPVVVSTAPSQIRHDWYQSNDSVTISLMVKGVPKDKATVEIGKSSISISFPLPTGSDYDFSLDPLFDTIDPAQSSYKVLSTKIELVLKKVTPGKKWHSLESESTEKPATDESQPSKVETNPPTTKSAPAGPSYPTSSKSGPKDWDKLARDLSTKPEEKGKDSEKETKDAGYESDDGGDPVNGFFKKLFKNADPDTRRAMMKSYTESNGTSLSTNWDEVKKAKVETLPPDGMEAREWEK